MYVYMYLCVHLCKYTCVCVCVCVCVRVRVNLCVCVIMSGILFFTCLKTNFFWFVGRYLIQLCKCKSVTLSSKSVNFFVSLQTNFQKVYRLTFEDLLHKSLQT